MTIKDFTPGNPDVYALFKVHFFGLYSYHNPYTRSNPYPNPNSNPNPNPNHLKAKI